jgi:hypothetical protein
LTKLFIVRQVTKVCGRDFSTKNQTHLLVYCTEKKLTMSSETGPHLCAMAKSLYEYVNKTFCNAENEDDDDGEPLQPAPPRQNSDEIAEGTQPLPPPALPNTDSVAATPLPLQAIQRAQLVLFLIAQFVNLGSSFLQPNGKNDYKWSVDDESFVNSNWKKLEIPKVFKEPSLFLDYWNWININFISRDKDVNEFSNNLLHNFVTMYNVVDKIVPGMATELDNFESVYQELANKSANKNDELVKTTALLCAATALIGAFEPELDDDTGNPYNFKKYANKVGDHYTSVLELMCKRICYENCEDTENNNYKSKSKYFCYMNCNVDGKIATKVENTTKLDNKKFNSFLKQAREKIIIDYYLTNQKRSILVVLNDLQKEHNKKTLDPTTPFEYPSIETMYAQISLYTIVSFHAQIPVFLFKRPQNLDWTDKKQQINKDTVADMYFELLKDKGFKVDSAGGNSTGDNLADQNTRNKELGKVWHELQFNLISKDNNYDFFTKAESLLTKFVTMYKLVRQVVTTTKDTLETFSQVYKELLELYNPESAYPDVPEAVLTTAFVCAHYALDNNTIDQDTYANGYITQVATWYKEKCNIVATESDSKCQDKEFGARDEEKWRTDDNKPIKEAQTNLKNKLWYIRYAFLKTKDSATFSDKGLVDEKGNQINLDSTKLQSARRTYNKANKANNANLEGSGLGGGHPPTDQSNITNTLRRYARFVRLSTKGEPTLADFYWHVRYPESIFQYRQKLLTNLEMPSQSQALAQAYEDKQVLTQWMRLQNRQVTATASGELINVGGNANADNEEQEDEEEEEEDQEEDEEDQEEEDDDQEEDEEDQEEDEEEEEDDDQEEAQKRGQNMSSFAPIMQQLAQVFEKSSPQTVQNELCWVR